MLALSAMTVYPRNLSACACMHTQTGEFQSHKYQSMQADRNWCTAKINLSEKKIRHR